jgi:hypothetical protein
MVMDRNSPPAASQARILAMKSLRSGVTTGSSLATCSEK